MKIRRVALAAALMAAVAFAAGWAFSAYLGPDAVVDFANRVLFCN